MALQGTANINRNWAYAKDPNPSEVWAKAQGTRLPFVTLTPTANPRITERKLIAHKGQRSGIGRSGFEIVGNAAGPFVVGAYDDWLQSLFQAKFQKELAPAGYLLNAALASATDLTVAIDTGTDVIPKGATFTIAVINTILLDSEIFTVSKTFIGGTGNLEFTRSGTFPGATAYAEDALLTFTNDSMPDALVNGEGRESMALEIEVPQGEGGIKTFDLYRGVEVSGCQISMTAGDDMSVSFDLVGMASTDPATDSVMETTGNAVKELVDAVIVSPHKELGGLDFKDGKSGGTSLKSINLHFRSLTIDFGVTGKEPQVQINSDDNAGINRGSIVPELTGQLYITEEFSKIVSLSRSGAKESNVAVTIGPFGVETGKKYQLYFPKCQFSEAMPEWAEEGPAYQNVKLLPIYSTEGFAYNGKGTVEIQRNMD